MHASADRSTLRFNFPGVVVQKLESINSWDSKPGPDTINSVNPKRDAFTGTDLSCTATLFLVYKKRNGGMMDALR